MRARRKSLLLSVTATIGLILPGPAGAWGGEGHALVGATARNLLMSTDPVLMRSIDDLMRQNLLRRTWTTPPRRGQRGPQHHVCNARNIEEMAKWPDCMRDYPGFNAFRPYHFDDVALCNEGPPPIPPPPPYCRQGTATNICATGQLERFRAVLRNSNASSEDRSLALAWVVHLVGDLHQPLHAETYDDRGGNGVSITLAPNLNPGYSTRYPSDNLHSFWDNDMVFAATHMPDGRSVEAEARSHLNAAGWSEADPQRWVAQSHRIAQRAYDELPARAYCPLRGRRMGPTTGGLIRQSYVNSFRADTRQQLAAASIRLAALLRSDFR